MPIEKKSNKIPLDSMQSHGIVPKGTLVHLNVSQLKPNPNNPRRLFDPSPLKELKDSIKLHGILVPLTVYKLPAQNKYAILDGERRYRCCVELDSEGINVNIPANVVEPPDNIASLIYMFNIHAFREQWELMPTSLSIKQLVEHLGGFNIDELHELTGLSYPQLERCRKILTFPERFQKLSLEVDPVKRIPSNFWIEIYPILELAEKYTPSLYAELGRDGVTDQLVDKYRTKKIKSVVHLRRISESFEVSELAEEKEEVADRLREYILDLNLETRTAFDGFIKDNRRYQTVISSADRFIKDVAKAKIDYTLEGKEELITKLMTLLTFVQDLIEKLSGGDPPQENNEGDTDD